ncbi:MAG: PIN domain-containing protein [Chitinophagaceae bacterium]|nr:PIN domain-containing protein [Chitinophagaceae bacterium]
MTRLFLDANILISVLNKEYPRYSYAARLLSLNSYNGTILVTSTLSLAITFYFAEKKHGSVSARKKLAMLLEHLVIADSGELEARKAIQNKQVQDFEDGMQFYSALHAGCNHIITHDTGDFYFSTITVVDPENYFKKFLPR